MPVDFAVSTCNIYFLYGKTGNNLYCVAKEDRLCDMIEWEICEEIRRELLWCTRKELVCWERTTGMGAEKVAISSHQVYPLAFFRKTELHVV